MYCPKCGIGDQTANAYCRRCGEFLIDASDKFNSVFKFFGINTPEKQINLNLVFDFVSVIFSLALLAFLIGYFRANADKYPTGKTPTVFYFVGAFLLFIAAWQFLGFILSINLKSKFSHRDVHRTAAANDAPAGETAAAKTLELLPPGEAKSFVPPSATENTTRELVKEARK